jgi:hypothetical protein
MRTMIDRTYVLVVPEASLCCDFTPLKTCRIPSYLLNLGSFMLSTSYPQSCIRDANWPSRRICSPARYRLAAASLRGRVV